MNYKRVLLCVLLFITVIGQASAESETIQASESNHLRDSKNTDDVNSIFNKSDLGINSNSTSSDNEPIDLELKARRLGHSIDVVLSKYKVSETYFGTNSLLCKNGCPAIDERERKGFGIYFVSYSSDNATALKYYDEAAKSARLLKNMNPDVPIAIATHTVIPDKDKDLFDIVVDIPERHIYKSVQILPTTKRIKQFFTRALYLTASPFQTTLHIDTTVNFCDKDAPMELLTKMSEADVDVAISSAVVGSYRSSGWAILYNWNVRTKIFFRDWIFLILTEGIQASDDQNYLNMAIHKAIVDDRCKFRRLSSNWAFVTRCYDGNGGIGMGRCPIKSSVVINGKVRMIHARKPYQCPLVNGEHDEYVDMVRAFIHIPYRKPRPVEKNVFSPKEQAEVFAPYTMPKLNWDMSDKPADSIFWGDCSSKQMKKFSKCICGCS